MLKKGAEIVTRHGRHAEMQGGAAGQCAGSPAHDLGLGRRVDHGRARQVVEADLDLRRSDPGRGLSDLLDPPPQQGQDLRAQAAESAGQSGFARNHVLGKAALERADGDDGRLERIDGPAHRLLDAGDEMAAGQHGIAGHVRHGGVTAGRLELQGKFPRSGHHRAIMDDHLAGRHIRPIVQAENIAGGEALEQAGIQHELGAAIALLRRLEHQIDRAAKTAGQREIGRRPQKHGHVAVMAAGVHGAGDLRAMVEAVVLIHGEGIHVGTQGHAGALPAPFDDADHAITADAGMDGNSHFGQPFGNEGRGPGFLAGDLRMTMQIVPH